MFFFKQKTAYEMRISDWSSDVCSSDLNRNRAQRIGFGAGRLSHTASIRPALVEGPLFSCDRRSRVKNGASTSSVRTRTGTERSARPAYFFRLKSTATTFEPSDRKSTRLNSSH